MNRFKEEGNVLQHSTRQINCRQSDLFWLASNYVQVNGLYQQVDQTEKTCCSKNNSISSCHPTSPNSKMRKQKQKVGLFSFFILEVPWQIQQKSTKAQHSSFPRSQKMSRLRRERKGTAICYGAESPKMALRNLVVAKIHDKNCWTVVWTIVRQLIVVEPTEHVVFHSILSL